MAFLYVTEFSEMPITDNAVGIGWAMTPPLVDQTPIVIGASSLASAAFNAQTKFVRLAVDSTTPCSVAFGAAGVTPTATTSNGRLAANSVGYYGVQGGRKVAVIANS
jgi:hypothetical protein